MTFAPQPALLRERPTPMTAPGQAAEPAPLADPLADPLLAAAMITPMVRPNGPPNPGRPTFGVSSLPVALAAGSSTPTARATLGGLPAPPPRPKHLFDPDLDGGGLAADAMKLGQGSSSQQRAGNATNLFGDFTGHGTGASKVEGTAGQLAGLQGDMDAGRWYDWGAAGDLIEARKEKIETGDLGPQEIGAYLEAWKGIDKGDGYEASSLLGSGTTGSDASMWAGAHGDAYGHAIGYEGVDSWLAGDRASATARVSADVGLGGMVSANAATSGGRAIGAWDPETGTREGARQAEAGAMASEYIGANASAMGEAYVEGLQAGVVGQAGAEVAVRNEAQAAAAAGLHAGSFELLGANAGAQALAEGRVGAGAQGEASASLTGGVSAKGSASAEVMARAQASATAGVAIAGVNNQWTSAGNAEAGAAAGAAGAFASGPGNIGGMGSAEAFAGARASGSLSSALSIGGVEFGSFSAEGSIAAGAGAGVGAGLMIKDGVLTINLELLLVAGAGGGLATTLQFDLLAIPKVILRAVADGARMSDDLDLMIPQSIGYIVQAAQGASFAEMSGAAGGSTDSSSTDSGSTASAASAASALATPVGGAFVGPVAPSPSAPTTAAARVAMPVGGVGLAPHLARGAQTVTAAMPAPQPAPTTAPASDLQTAVTQAGGRFDAAKGRIDMSAPTADPRSLLGAIPGPMGAAHDAQLQPVVQAVQQAQALAQEASAEGHEAVANAMAGLEQSMSNPLQAFAGLLQGGIDQLASLVQNGLATVRQIVGGIQAVARDVIRAIAARIADAIRALFGGGEGSQYDKASADSDRGMSSAKDRLKAAADSVKSTRLGAAGVALRGMMDGVSQLFLSSARGPLDAATAKANRAEALLDSVDGRKLDLAGSKGAIAINPAGTVGVHQVASSLDDLGGAGLEGVTGGIDRAGDQLAGEGDKAAGEADRATAKATHQMDQAYAPKREADKEVRSQEAAGDTKGPRKGPGRRKRRG